MNFQEFGNIAMALRTYYPREKLFPNEQAVMLWYEQLSDLDYRATEAAIKSWIATNKWSPSIAEIRELTMDATFGVIKDWGQAWEETRAAVRRYGRYNPEAALESLDELTREAVKRVGFYDLCASENHAADRANFKIIYEQLANRRRTDRQTPMAVRQRLEQIQKTAIGENDEI